MEKLSNQERREQGLPYRFDGECAMAQVRAKELLQKLNSTIATDFPTIIPLVAELLGKSEGAYVHPPFHCNYGHNIETGKGFFANYGCTILDAAKVTIGDNCQLGPHVSIYTSGHPVHPVARNSGYEYAIEVSIGDNVWIGGNSVICPGVHIGSNTVIGAGSVVTRDIPDGVIAAGNPCRVIREITDDDMKYYYKDRPFDEDPWAEIHAL